MNIPDMANGPNWLYIFSGVVVYSVLVSEYLSPALTKFPHPFRLLAVICAMIFIIMWAAKNVENQQ